MLSGLGFNGLYVPASQGMRPNGPGVVPTPFSGFNGPIPGMPAQRPPDCFCIAGGIT